MSVCLVQSAEWNGMEFKRGGSFQVLFKPRSNQTDINTSQYIITIICGIDSDLPPIHSFNVEGFL